MARVAQIIGREDDIWGARWDIRERRATDHGFDLCLGWPEGEPRGKGGSGGIRVIVTHDLADYLDHLRDTPARITLPCGRNTIKRLRRLMGHYWAADRYRWWAERVDDLATLPLDQFAARHGTSTGAASMARRDMLGPRLRERGWWRDPSIIALLTSGRATSIIADELGVAAVTVRKLRAAAEISLSREASETRGPKRGKVGSMAIDDVIKMRSNGVTQAEIGKIAGVSGEAVSSALRRAGIRHMDASPRARGKGTVGILTLDEVVALRETGKTYREIGEAAGVSIEAVINALRRKGLLRKGLRGKGKSNPKEARPGRRKGTVGILTLDEVVALREAGKTYREIGEAAGVGTTTIQMALRRNGLLRKGLRGKTKKAKKVGLLSVDQVIEMHHQGKSLRDIAKIAGVTYQWVSQAIKMADPSGEDK